MATILSHLPRQAAFEPDVIVAMSTALEETCTALAVLSGDTRGRETIAVRIIDLASRGVIDAAALREWVLSDVHELDSD